MNIHILIVGFDVHGNDVVDYYIGTDHAGCNIKGRTPLVVQLNHKIRHHQV